MLKYELKIFKGRISMNQISCNLYSIPLCIILFEYVVLIMSQVFCRLQKCKKNDGLQLHGFLRRYITCHWNVSKEEANFTDLFAIFWIGIKI